MSEPTTQPAFAAPAGSACRFKIVATTDTSIRTFQGTAVAQRGQCATLDELLIGLISGIVREEKLVLLGITIEAIMESPNAPASATPNPEAKNEA